MTKTGWDMTDEELGCIAWGTYTGVTLHGSPDMQRKAGAAILALFPCPVVPTRDALEKWWTEHRERHEGHAIIDILKAAFCDFSYFAPAAPTRGDVPSVEEVFNNFAASEKVRDAVAGAAIGRGSISHECAVVARAMMLELVPRKRMMIEGMDQNAIHAKLQFAASYNAISQNALAGIVKEVLRLANTPTSEQEIHSDEAAVRRFAERMILKMASSREKGRSGWEKMADHELWALLRHHVDKGDPVDVANLAMMVSENNHRTPAPEDADREAKDALWEALMNTPDNPLGEIDAIWERMTEPQRDYWRAVAGRK